MLYNTARAPGEKLRPSVMTDVDRNQPLIDKAAPEFELRPSVMTDVD